MGPKANKGTRSSCNKEVSGPRAWPDLPQQLLSLIARHSSLMQNISFGGPTKTWRATPRKCIAIGKSPWLQLFDSGEDECHAFNLSFYKGEYRWYGQIPPRSWRRLTSFAGYSHGLLLVRRPEPADWAPRDLGECTWYIRPWDLKIPFKFATLSSSPQRSNGCIRPCFVLVLTGICYPALAFYRFGGGVDSWMKQDSSLIDPYS